MPTRGKGKGGGSIIHRPETRKCRKVFRKPVCSGGGLYMGR